VSLTYLLDTNTASFIIRGNPVEVIGQLARVSADQTAISAVTEAELLFGIERRPQSNQLKTIVTRFLEQATILKWDSQAAREYAGLRTGLEASGKRMGALDMMIAAHALAEHLILVTNDHAFSQVARLRLEDWTRPQGKIQ
jgi:tRNA(fMet)-specific endonuclease VapC